MAKAEESKNNGNTAFKAGKYDEAVQLYKEAIGALPFAAHEALLSRHSF